MNDNSTRATLLLKIRDRSDATAWTDFVQIYAPLLYAYALKAGLQDADAADLAQDTMRQVICHIDRFEYQRDRGSFRGWLFTIARNGIRKNARSAAKKPRGVGDTTHQELLSEQAAPVEQDPWEPEYRRRIFEVASEKIKEDFHLATWQAFWRTSVDGVAAAEVAAELGVSLGAVYIARSRVLSRLREEVRELDE